MVIVAITITTTAIILTPPVTATITTMINKWKIIILRMNWYKKVAVAVKVIQYGSSGGLLKGNKNNSNNSRCILDNKN